MFLQESTKCAVKTQTNKKKISIKKCLKHQFMFRYNRILDINSPALIKPVLVSVRNVAFFIIPHVQWRLVMILIYIPFKLLFIMDHDLENPLLHFRSYLYIFILFSNMYKYTYQYLPVIFFLNSLFSYFIMFSFSNLKIDIILIKYFYKIFFLLK
jgi:hypothetical protein